MTYYDTEPQTDLREKMGFLCRWSLLALAAGILAAAAWTAVAATAAIPKELEARILLPDSIWQAGHGSRVRDMADLGGRGGSRRLAAVRGPLKTQRIPRRPADTRRVTGGIPTYVGSLPSRIGRGPT